MEYHKIHTMFKRDMEGDRYLIEGEWATPEFAYLANNMWEFTEKVDGTNIRIMWDGEKVRFGGRTDKASIPAKLNEVLIDTFRNDVLEAEFGTGGSVVLYGEGCGAGIQKGGGNYYQDQQFVLFDVRVGPWWLKREDVDEVAAIFGVQSVPVIGKGTLEYGINVVKGGLKSAWGDFLAEGVVPRTDVGLMSRSGERIITKIKHRDFK